MTDQHVIQVARGEATVSPESAIGQSMARIVECRHTRAQVRASLEARKPEAARLTQNAKRLTREGGSSSEIAAHNIEAIELDSAIDQADEQLQCLAILEQRLIAEHEQLNAEFKGAYLELQELTKPATGWELGPAAAQRQVRLSELRQALHLLVGG